MRVRKLSGTVPDTPGSVVQATVGNESSDHLARPDVSNSQLNGGIETGLDGASSRS